MNHRHHRHHSPDSPSSPTSLLSNPLTLVAGLSLATLVARHAWSKHSSNKKQKQWHQQYYADEDDEDPRSSGRRRRHHHHQQQQQQHRGRKRHRQDYHHQEAEFDGYASGWDRPGGYVDGDEHLRSRRHARSEERFRERSQQQRPPSRRPSSQRSFIRDPLGIRNNNSSSNNIFRDAAAGLYGNIKANNSASRPFPAEEVKIRRSNADLRDGNAQPAQSVAYSQRQAGAGGVRGGPAPGAGLAPRPGESIGNDEDEGDLAYVLGRRPMRGRAT